MPQVLCHGLPKDMTFLHWQTQKHGKLADQFHNPPLGALYPCMIPQTTQANYSYQLGQQLYPNYRLNFYGTNPGFSSWQLIMAEDLCKTWAAESPSIL